MYRQFRMKLYNGSIELRDREVLMMHEQWMNVFTNVLLNLWIIWLLIVNCSRISS